MSNKRILPHALSRVLYAGGTMFFIAGLLLLAVSANVSALGFPGSVANQVDEPNPECPCQSALAGGTDGLQAMQSCPCKTSSPVQVTPGSGDSSLVFTTNCSCSCESASATVCNVGGEDMVDSVPWQLYYSAGGNPAGGQVVQSGELGPLDSGECVVLDQKPAEAGNYAFRLVQEDGAGGPAEVWSTSCGVSSSCFPPPVPLTPTVTRTSRPQLPVNLVPVCGYPEDEFLVWRVANNTDSTVDFTWDVDNSDENGRGTVEPHVSVYFTTTTGQKTIRLYVDGEIVDTEPSNVSPCKRYLELSYACTEAGPVFSVTNPNDFDASFTWSLDGVEQGSGSASAGGTVELGSAAPGEHVVSLTWADARHGEQTVTLEVDDACGEAPPTLTPTFTSTAPGVEITITPPTETFTPTPTNTQPGDVTDTPTPTFTSTAPGVEITLTDTPTSTATATATSTVTPTATSTATATATATVPPGVTSTFTFTPTVTQTSPPQPGLTYGLVPFCGYPDDTQLVWQVTNSTGVAVDFTWQVVGTGESGSGVLPANGSTFIYTSAGSKVIDLFINGQLVTSVPSQPACYQPLTLGYVCASPNTVNWYVTNQNNLSVPYVWGLDNQYSGQSTVPPNTSQVFAITGLGQHTASMTWLIEPLGPRAATLTANVVSCSGNVGTITPIVTLPPPVITSTPVIIPITGADYAAPVEVAGLLGWLFTATGLFLFGLGLVATAATGRKPENKW